MKRYLVFGGSDYYPSGGWGDFCFDADTLEEVKPPKDCYGDICDWWHVIDQQSGEKVLEGGYE